MDVHRENSDSGGGGLSGCKLVELECSRGGERGVAREKYGSGSNVVW